MNKPLMQTNYLPTAALWLLAAFSSVGGIQARPLQLHPDNPHYFLFQGKPAVLIGSTEHYGAVLNLDFDYVRYLDALRDSHLNLTRTFSGAYVEPVGAFHISENTLAPGPGRFICPWARSAVPGYPNGGNKFDLSRWDPAYFKRLRDFVAQAERRGIVVEMNFFTPFYEESMWELSPQKASNNINGVGNLARTNAYTLQNGKLLYYQERMVEKIVAELKGFDNVYYEICNEPYFGGVTLHWQRHIASVIARADAAHPHLISQNIANGRARINQPDPFISIFNFHYATPPDTVALNYDLEKPIGDNETGFKGVADLPYRIEAWEFMMAGGALFNHLDYSFTAGHEAGNFSYPTNQPGGGSASLRKQFSILKGFLESFDFLKMKPNQAVITPGESRKVWVLAEPGKQYAIYLRGGPGALSLTIPEGKYRLEWIDTKTGLGAGDEAFEHPGGGKKITPPGFQEDVALRIKRVGEERKSKR